MSRARVLPALPVLLSLATAACAAADLEGEVAEPPGPEVTAPEPDALPAAAGVDGNAPESAPRDRVAMEPVGAERADGGTDGGVPGDATPLAPDVTGPLPVFAALPQKSAALGIGPFHLCLLRPSLELDCGQGTPAPGTPTDRSNPPPGLTAVQIAAGHIHNCVLTPPGTAERVRCIRNPAKNFYSWADVPRGLRKDPVQLVAADLHSCVLNRDGSVACWGKTDSRSTPPAGLRAKWLSASGAMTCAIRTDDSVVCWGVHPAEPPAGLAAVRVVANTDGYNRLDTLAIETRHACAIRLDGSVVCWGDNNHRQLEVPPGVRARELALGRSFSCALLLDGQVQCWGRFGASSPTGATVEALPPGFRAKAIAANNRIICAIGEDDVAICPGNRALSGKKVYVPN